MSEYCEFLLDTEHNHIVEIGDDESLDKLKKIHTHDFHVIEKNAYNNLKSILTINKAAYDLLHKEASMVLCEVMANTNQTQKLETLLKKYKDPYSY